MKEKIKNGISFLRVMPILLGINWTDKKLERDLIRWKKINKLTCCAR